MATGVYRVTEMFEQALCRYTGAPYAVAIDNCSNALFLALKWVGVDGVDVAIPSHTYPSVPNAVIHAGGHVQWRESTKFLKGAYELGDTKVWDCALRFTHNMYQKWQYQCLSFTGPYKHLKLGKGGAILTDNEDAYKWFKRARYSGRRECSYHEDAFDMLGWNFYMLPEIATVGLRLITQFYDHDGTALSNDDLTLPYPDLSEFPFYTNK